MSVRRHRPSGVVPLELWDVLLGEQPLYLVASDEQPRAVAEAVRQLAAGTARRLRGASQLPRLGFEQVVLAGGGPLHAVAAALRARGFSASIANDAPWIAERGGRALLATFCDPAGGAVLDVGQTTLKYSDRTGRASVPRPLDRVPLELNARAQDLLASFRANTIAFIAEPLARGAPLTGLVLALPCEIDDALTVQGCSYPWQAGDTSLVVDLLRAAGLANTPCLVLNDAELAAVSVDVSLTHQTSDFDPPRTRRGGTLVLTLGLGLGAALLVQRPSEEDDTHVVPV